MFLKMYIYYTNAIFKKYNASNNKTEKWFMLVYKKILNEFSMWVKLRI